MKQACKTFLFLLLFGFLCTTQAANSTVSAEPNPFVPYPKKIVATGQKASFEIAGLDVDADATTTALSKVIKEDVYRLAGIKPKDGAPVIYLSLDDCLKKECYQVQVDAKKITIKGGSYSAVSAGWISVLQAAVIEKGQLIVPEMEISDYPDLEYRGLMLDLARRFHSCRFVKQAIDMCRWYKLNCLHLHLSDDQSFVFPTTKFPKLLREGFYYTPDEIREIVAYADERGVTLVPEIEGPGHSNTLRSAYPEIFGEKDYRCMDLSDDKATEAMKALAEEVMEAFPSSPYFHIGADESDLSRLKELPHVIRKIEEKGYDDVHDLYLDYVREMHTFIRSKGKQTAVWEGFDHDGSRKVKIPNDITVFAFETLYQRPDSLVNNGYHILNTAWVPLYVTANQRWSTRKIFDWNYYTWESWVPWTPAGKAPIVLNERERKHIIGAQFCSWELNEEMEYPTLCKRLGAMSERIWNTAYMSDYESFEKRLSRSEAKLKRLVYPVKITATGLNEPDYKGQYYNRENYFSEQLILSVKPELPGAVLHYTIDERFPTKESPVLPEKLTLSTTTFLKLAMYDAGGTLLFYHPVLFEHRPFKVEFEGDDHNENNPDRTITFDRNVTVKITKLPSSGSIHYTLDGNKPSISSPEYTKEFTISDNCRLNIRYFDKQRKAKGENDAYSLKVNND